VRLFVGLFPPAEAISHAAEAVDRISSTTPDVRWVPPERWHLTCVFLGDVPHSPRRVGTALDQALAGLPPIEEVRLAGAGTFPGVLWLGIDQKGAELRAESAAGVTIAPMVRLPSIVSRIRGEMRSLGMPVSDRLWVPHLTIGRWRSSDAEPSATGAVHALSRYGGPAFTVREVHLVQSITGPEPRYDVLHTATLR